MGRHRKRDDEEREANHFARCLLMPEVIVEKFFAGESLTDENFHRFAKAFDVPVTQAMRRLVELGYCGK